MSEIFVGLFAGSIARMDLDYKVREVFNMHILRATIITTLKCQGTHLRLRLISAIPKTLMGPGREGGGRHWGLDGEQVAQLGLGRSIDKAWGERALWLYQCANSPEARFPKFTWDYLGLLRLRVSLECPRLRVLGLCRYAMPL